MRNIKISILTVLTIIITASIFYSCSSKNDVILLQEGQNNFEDISKLSKDNEFFNLISQNINLINQISDINKAKELTSKDYSLSNEELHELSISFGFNNYNEYQLFFNQQSITLQNLNNKYNLKTISKDRLIEIGIESINNKNENINLKASDPCNCERIRTNCIIGAAAGATIGHLGCLSVDWTGIGAPIYHGAVIVLQIVISDTCNADAENCVRECDEHRNEN